MSVFTYCEPRHRSKSSSSDEEIDIFTKWDDDANSVHCVLKLDEEIFEDFLLENALTLVFFQNPEVPESEQARIQFFQAAHKSKHKHHGFGEVNCSQSPTICSRENVSSVPYFKLYQGITYLGFHEEPATIDDKGILKWIDAFNI